MPTLLNITSINRMILKFFKHILKLFSPHLKHSSRNGLKNMLPNHSRLIQRSWTRNSKLSNFARDLMTLISKARKTIMLLLMPSSRYHHPTITIRLKTETEMEVGKSQTAGIILMITRYSSLTPNKLSAQISRGAIITEITPTRTPQVLTLTCPNNNQSRLQSRASPITPHTNPEISRLPPSTFNPPILVNTTKIRAQIFRCSQSVTSSWTLLIILEETPRSISTTPT